MLSTTFSTRRSAALAKWATRCPRSIRPAHSGQMNETRKIVHSSSPRIVIGTGRSYRCVLNRVGSPNPEHDRNRFGLAVSRVVHADRPDPFLGNEFHPLQESADSADVR